MIENVPLMIAWLPTTEARIANISTGHLTLSAAKNLHDVFYNMLSYRQENSYTFRKLIKALLISSSHIAKQFFPSSYLCGFLQILVPTD